MKKLLILFLISLNTFSYSQEIQLNEDLNLYEYTQVIMLEDDIDSKLDFFENQFQKLSYSDIKKSDDIITAKNFFTKMIFGSAMEVHYNTSIEFKENRYRILINNFRVRDERYGAVAIETLKKRSTKKWVNFINEELPGVLANLKSKDDW